MKISNSILSNEKLIYILICIGVILRFLFLGEESLWLDEVLTIKEYNSETLSEFFTYLKESSPHPPLYFLFMHFWMGMFEYSDYVMRFPSLIFSSVSLWLYYKIAKEIESINPIALMIIVVTSPTLIYFAQEARPYALLLMLSLASIYSFLRYLNGSRGIAYIIINLILMLTHYISIVLVIAQHLYFFWVKKQEKKALLKWLGINVVILVMYLPWLPSLMHQLSHKSLINWISELSVINVLKSFSFFAGYNKVLLVCLFLLFFYGLYGEVKRRNFGFIFIGFSFSFSFLIIYSLLFQNLFIFRYMSINLIFFYLLCAIGLSDLIERMKDKRLGFSSLVFIGFLIIGVSSYDFLVKDNWRAVGKEVDGLKENYELTFIPYNSYEMLRHYGHKVKDYNFLEFYELNSISECNSSIFTIFNSRGLPLKRRNDYLEELKLKGFKVSPDYNYRNFYFLNCN